VEDGLLVLFLRRSASQVGRSDGWPPRPSASHRGRGTDRIPPTGRLTVTTRRKRIGLPHNSQPPAAGSELGLDVRRFVLARRNLKYPGAVALTNILLLSSSVVGLLWASSNGNAGLSGSPGDLKLHKSMAARAASTLPARGAPMPTTGASSSPTGPRTSEHYGANGNFSGPADQPGADGFNLADVSSNAQTAALPAGMKGLAWIGSCAGATAAFRSTIRSYIGDPKVFGFYLMDEPDPSVCSAANLKSESEWIHANDPATYTFIVETDLSVSSHPTYMGGYNPANSDIDLYGIDSYPCRSENPRSAPCQYSWLVLSVTAAEREGIPLAAIVPVYQTFGGGTWVDDEGGSYKLPTAAQESKILSTWAQLVPTPVFDYAYSWGSQHGDRSLISSPPLQQVFLEHNKREGRDLRNPHYKLVSLRSSSMAAERVLAAGVLPDPPGSTSRPTTFRCVLFWVNTYLLS